ncbi:hypothetical protein [Blastochloris tepida]|uniref:DNA-binding protein n=1 Tax=Blastochloris tepida TaxID=2233851 RepID=A0A348G457_9HYPH|nr:hypothetical protein [Blastochloris tepida]BBF94340.1 hypothetical protein BLTE_30250 [Blastochloris tepida]
MPVRATPVPLPPRIAARPDPAQWGADELLTFAEAAALFWPYGPLTATSLRTAYRQGLVDVVMIARKVFVTPAALARMTAQATRPAPARSGEAVDGK